MIYSDYIRVHGIQSSTGFSNQKWLEFKLKMYTYSESMYIYIYLYIIYLYVYTYVYLCALAEKIIKKSFNN